MSDIKNLQKLVHGVVPVTRFNSQIAYDPLILNRIFAHYHQELYSLYSDPLGADHPIHPGFTWDQFLKNCLFDLRITPRGDTGRREIRNFKKENFETAEQFYTRCVSLSGDDGMGHTTEVCDAEIYSLIDPEIPTIGRMYGYNKFYQMLRGDYNGIGTKKSSLYFYENNSQPFHLAMGNEILDRIFSQIWGVDIGIAAELDPDIQRQKRGVFWISPRRNKNLYKLPNPYGPPFAGVTVGLGGDRYAFDIVNSTLSLPTWSNPPSGGGGGGGSIPDPSWIIQKVKYFGIPLDAEVTDISLPNSNWPYESLGQLGQTDCTISSGAPDLNDWASCLLGTSVIACYGVQDYADPNRKAIFIKPALGMDTFSFPKYDSDRYQLEMVYSVDGKKPHVAIPDMSVDYPEASYINFMSIRMRLKTIFAAMNKSIGTRAVVHQNYPSFVVKFYFRRKGTPYISPVSPFVIKGVNYNHLYRSTMISHEF